MICFPTAESRSINPFTKTGGIREKSVACSLTENSICGTRSRLKKEIYMPKKAILVTGGSGLVGAYAVGMLLERGEREPRPTTILRLAGALRISVAALLFQGLADARA